MVIAGEHIRRCNAECDGKAIVEKVNGGFNSCRL